MASTIGSINSLPVLPDEPSLDLGPLKRRMEKMAAEKPLWKRDQENILYATNRISNVPSYVPRFSHVEQSHKYDGYVIPTESQIEATLSPRDKFFKRLAKPPAYRTRKKAMNADHRIIHIKNYSPRLCYSTPRGMSDAKQNPLKSGGMGDLEKIEKERMGYNMIAKAKHVLKFRIQRRKSLEEAAARNEPFAIKRLNSYRPKPPSQRQRPPSNSSNVQPYTNTNKNNSHRNRKRSTQSARRKNKKKIEPWNADSEWVKYVPTGEQPEDKYVNIECGRFENYVDDNKNQFSPRDYDATQQEEKYATNLLKECDDRRIKRIFKNYKPEFKESDYRPTYLIKLASDTYAKRLVAGRVDSKPVEVSWKIVTELDVLRHMNKKAHFKQVYQKSAALNFLQKEAEAQQFDDY